MSDSLLKLTISLTNGELIMLDVNKDESVENLKALLEVQTGILLRNQRLFYDGKELDNLQTLSQAKLKTHDVLLLQEVQSSLDSQQTPLLSQAATFVEYVKNNNYILQQLKRVNPSVAEAIQKGNLQVVGDFLLQQELAKREKERQEEEQLNRINADPFNPEYQRLIEERIKMENINQNMENALDHLPESFARVVMLYIDCSVNGTPVKAFVDSGAQQTIMSRSCARRCGIERLIDTRYQGVAKGVGEAKIIGRVHLAPIQVGNAFFPCSFTILEDQGVEFLLGLDMLRRHQCIIDLKENVLKIGDVAVPFLAEKDLPLSAMFSDMPPSPQHDSSPSSPSLPPVHPNPVPLVVPPINPVPPISNPTTSSQPRPPQQITQQRPPQQPPQQRPVATNTQPNPLARNPLPQQSPFSLPQPPPFSQQPPSSFPESSIKALTDLGFTRNEVIQALTICKGNVEAAAAYLFSG